MTRSWLITVLVMLVLPSCSTKPIMTTPPPPIVGVAQPLVRQMPTTRYYYGRVEPIDHAEIAARVSGTVRRVLVPGGSTVVADQPLLEIDDRPFAIAVQRAEAAVVQARIALRQAEDARDRARRLFAEGKLAEHLRDEAERQAETAAAVLAGAEAQLAHAQLEYSWTIVRAPFPGRLGLWSVSPGSQVIGGGMITPTTLTTLTTITPVYVAWDLDEPTYLSLRTRLTPSADNVAPLTVRIGLINDADFVYHGRIVLADNHVDPASGTVRVRALIKDADLPPGAYARIALDVAPPRSVTLVHEQAIHARLTSRYVYTIDANGHVHVTPVRVGERHAPLVVVEGLDTETAVVVTDAARILHSGQTVRTRRVDMTSLRALE